MVDLSVNLGELKLDNPVIPASGTFGYGEEYLQFYDIRILGSIACKGTTKEERFGNPTPRIAECENGVVNSIGLQNPGIDVVMREKLPRLREIYGKPVIANISGFSVDELVYCCEKVNKSENVGIIELNISCPNVHGGGMSLGVCPASAAEATAAVKKVTDKPVYVKLTPNVTDITEIAVACEKAGADGLSLINTMLGMRVDLKTRKPILGNIKGGYSGRAIFPSALRFVYEVYEKVSIPIIGIGGISCAEDVIEMMLCGASAIEIGAENLINPYVCKEVIEDLPRVMEKYNINNLREIIGGAHRG